MRFTGLSEFLWFLLLFGAMFAFTVWRQQRDRRRREERMAALSTPVQSRPGPVAVSVPVPAGLETAPDISWGRGPSVPVPPPEVAPDWTDVPPRAEPLPLPAPPVAPATAGARRTAPPRPAVARRSQVVQLRSAAGLRQAVVALTVLGPCRALEPYGAPGPRQEPGAGRDPAR